MSVPRSITLLVTIGVALIAGCASTHSPTASTTDATVSDRVGQVSVTHPVAWRLVPFVERGADYVPLFYLSDAPIALKPCPSIDPTTGEDWACPTPINDLAPNGVLVTVIPNQGLAAIVPPRIDRQPLAAECVALHGDREVSSVVGAVVIIACLRGPDVDRLEGQVTAMIRSVSGAW